MHCPLLSGFHEICSLFWLYSKQMRIVRACDRKFASKHLVNFFNESFDQILKEKDI